jgi:predicted ATPase
LHGAVARGLESLEAHAPRDDLVNDLAWHYTEARDAPRAVPYLAMAAGAALRRGAYREAVGHIETGLRLGEGSSGAGLTELRIDLQDMLAIARVMGEGWGHPDIEPSLEKALSLCTELDDPQRRSVILYHLGAVYEGRGQHEKSQALLEQRLELESSGSDSTPLLESHELLACSMFHQGGFEGSLSHAETGWSLYDPERHLALVASAAGDNLGVSCMCWAALDLWSLGHADKAAERMAQALKLAGDPSHSYCLARAHEQTATLHQLRREPDVVLRHATATIDLSLERGYDLRAVSGAMLRGWARVHLGDPEGGLAELQEGLDDYLQSGADINVPHFVGLLADAWLQTGNFENCLKTVARALGAMLTSSFYYEPELHRLDGLARIGLGALDPGRESLRRAVDIARTQKARFFELRAASAIARHAPNGDERKQALTSLGSVYGGFKDTSVTPDLVEAKALLAG